MSQIVFKLNYGFLSVRFYGEKGGEYRKYKIEEFANKFGFKIEFSPFTIMEVDVQLRIFSLI